MKEIFWQGSDLKSKVLLAYLRSPNHPMKIRLIRGLISKIFPEGMVVKNQLGAKIRVQPHDYIGWSILSTGSYEGVTLALAAEILKVGGIFLDIGTCFGLFTCSLGVLKNVECYSIEPYANSFIKLQDNIDLNPGVIAKLFNVALDKEVNLLEIENFNAGNSATVRVVLDDKHSNIFRHTVAATTLQKLLSHAKAKRITLMKLDVEGYELPILEGLDWQGSLRPRNVIIEFTDYSARAMGNGRKSVLEFFAARGYKGFTVDGKPLSLEQNTLEDNAWFRDIKAC